MKCIFFNAGNNSRNWNVNECSSHRSLCVLGNVVSIWNPCSSMKSNWNLNELTEFVEMQRKSIRYFLIRSSDAHTHTHIGQWCILLIAKLHRFLILIYWNVFFSINTKVKYHDYYYTHPPHIIIRIQFPINCKRLNCTWNKQVDGETFVWTLETTVKSVKYEMVKGNNLQIKVFRMECIFFFFFLLQLLAYYKYFIFKLKCVLLHHLFKLRVRTFFFLCFSLFLLHC